MSTVPSIKALFEDFKLPSGADFTALIDRLSRGTHHRPQATHPESTDGDFATGDTYLYTPDGLLYELDESKDPVAISLISFGAADPGFPATRSTAGLHVSSTGDLYHFDGVSTYTLLDVTANAAAIAINAADIATNVSAISSNAAAIATNGAAIFCLTELDHIQEMEGYSGIDGKYYLVHGYYAKGDAGEPWTMIYRATGRSGVTIDGGFYVTAPGADDYWEALDQNTLWLRRFGLHLEADASAAFVSLMQLCDSINDARTGTGEHPIWIDGEDATITATVVIPDDHPFRVRVRNLRINAVNAADTTLTLDPATVYTNNLEFHNCAFGGGAIGVKQTVTHFARYLNCSFGGTLAGVRSYRSFGCELIGCGFSGEYGYVGLGSGITGYEGDHTFDRCVFGASKIGIFIVNPGDLNIPHGCTFSNCLQQAPIGIKMMLINVGSHTRPLKLTGNYWEGPATADVDFSNLGDIDLSALDPDRNGTGALTTTALIADGSLAQFWNCLGTADSLHESGVHSSSLSVAQSQASIIQSGDNSLVINSLYSYAGNQNVLNTNFRVGRILNYRSATARGAMTAFCRSLGKNEWDAKASNYGAFPNGVANGLPDESSWIVEAGTPTLEVLPPDGTLTNIIRVAGSATDLISHQGNVATEQRYLVNEDFDRYLLMTFLVRADANTDLLVKAVNHFDSGSFTATPEWQRHMMLVWKSGYKRDGSQIRFETTGTIEIANVSVTLHDTQGEAMDYMEAGLIPGWNPIAGVPHDMGGFELTTVADDLPALTGTGEGDVVWVTGYYAAGDAGDPWAFIYHTSGRPVTDGGFSIPAAGADDWWEAADKETARAKRFGCKDDYAYSQQGTDNAPMMNLMFAAAAAEGAHVLIERGNYLIADTVNITTGVNNLDCRGVTIQYTGDRTKHIFDVTATLGQRVWHLPQFIGRDNAAQAVPLGAENAACVAFRGQCTDNDIYFRGLRRMPTGVLLAPESGVGFCAYNRFYGGWAAGCRTGIALVGQVNVSETGWINENSFYGFNITNSDSQYVGSTQGVRFDAAAGGYTGQNNNRFYATCFQVGGYTEAEQKLTIGKTALATDRRYVNRDVDLQDDGYETYGEYICTAVGSGGIATVPTHTTVGQDVVDGNGYGFTYTGHFYRVPVMHANAAGGRNLFSGCRWEGGDGPFAVIYQSSATGPTDNDYESYKNTSDALRAGPQIRYHYDAGGVQSYSDRTYNRFRTYTDDSNRQQVVFADVHRRAIKSANGWTIAGMNWYDYFTGEVTLTEDETCTLCFDSLILPSGSHRPGFLIRPNGVQLTRIEEIWPAYETDQAKIARQLLVGFKDRSRYQITGSQDANFRTSMGTSPNPDYDFYASQVAETYSQNRLNPDVIDELLVVFAAGRLTSVEVQTISETGASRPPSIGNWLGESTPWQSKRMSEGTPICGMFQTAGEFISNLDTTTGQPVGWYVTTTGFLIDTSWVTATAYEKNEIIKNSSNQFYIALSAGTSGATEPTGTGTQNDDVIDWRYIGTEATLTAATQTYP